MKIQDTLPNEIKEKLDLYLALDVSTSILTNYKSRNPNLKEIIFLDLPEEKSMQVYKEKVVDNVKYAATVMITYSSITDVDTHIFLMFLQNDL